MSLDMAYVQDIDLMGAVHLLDAATADLHVPLDHGGQELVRGSTAGRVHGEGDVDVLVTADRLRLPRAVVREVESGLEPATIVVGLDPATEGERGHRGEE